MKLGLVLWVWVHVSRTLVCVQMLECKKKKEKTASVKVIPLVVWEFGKAPRILCRQWRRSSTKPGSEDVGICAAHLLQR